MSKKNQGNNSGRKGSKISSKMNKIDLGKLNGREYKKVMKNIYRSPDALYLASGVGTVILARFLFRYYKDHPEIAEFMRDNFDTVGARIRELSSQNIKKEDFARH